MQRILGGSKELVNRQIRVVTKVRSAALVLCGVVCTFAGPAMGVRAQEGESGYTREKIRRYFQSQAEAYEIQLDDAKQPLQLRNRPVMNWQNTERAQVQGALYAWFEGGRPAVIGSIFTYAYRDQVRSKHELISLSEAPLRAQLAGVAVWSPRSSGVQWHEISDAGEPGSSGARRLTQMRAIARKFSGKLTQPDGKTTKLKLLPQPLIRYQAADQHIIDGAIFSLAIATDPEVFLLIEAYEQDGTGIWRYSPVRSHFWQVSLSTGEREVWNAPLEQSLQSAVANQFPEVAKPYFTFRPPTPLPPAEELQ